MPRYLFDHLEQIKNQVNNKKVIFLFLDYDGTLITFQDRPDKVFTPAHTKNIIRNLTKIDNIQVFIITGRKLDQIKKLIDIKEVSYAALHGLVIDFRDGEKFIWPQAKEITPLLKKIKNETYSRFKSDDRIILEDKKYTFAFHYRMLPKDKVQSKKGYFLEIVNGLDKENKLDIIKGDKVIEIRPSGWDKGKAVENIINRRNEKSDFLPIYIGDDTTDEDAFRYLDMHGLTVYVQNSSNFDTNANYYLNNPGDVHRFLSKLYSFLA